MHDIVGRPGSKAAGKPLLELRQLAQECLLLEFKLASVEPNHGLPRAHTVPRTYQCLGEQRIERGGEDTLQGRRQFHLGSDMVGYRPRPDGAKQDDRRRERSQAPAATRPAQLPHCACRHRGKAVETQRQQRRGHGDELREVALRQLGRPMAGHTHDQPARRISTQGCAGDHQSRRAELGGERGQIRITFGARPTAYATATAGLVDRKQLPRDATPSIECRASAATAEHGRRTRILTTHAEHARSG